MTLTLVKILDGSMCGEGLWQNDKFITPNKARSKAMISFLKKRYEKMANKSEKK
jgi:hypothetical protein